MQLTLILLGIVLVVAVQLALLFVQVAMIASVARTLFQGDAGRRRLLRLGVFFRVTVPSTFKRLFR